MGRLLSISDHFSVYIYRPGQMCYLKVAEISHYQWDSSTLGTYYPSPNHINLCRFKMDEIPLDMRSSNVSSVFICQFTSVFVLLSWCSELVLIKSQNNPEPM